MKCNYVSKINISSTCLISKQSQTIEMYHTLSVRDICVIKERFILFKN